jgi:hypothetical protein
VAVVALCACGASGSSHAPPAPVERAAVSDTPATSHAALGDARPAAHCIVNPKAVIVVLDFACGNAGCEQRGLPEITRRFRDEVKQLGLSSYRGQVIDEELLGGCDAKPDDDGRCMGGIGRRLHADWLLWGLGYANGTVGVQLVPTGDPSARRTLTFAVGANPEATVHAAWVQISSE